MNSLTAKTLIVGLMMTLPVQVARAEASLTLASECCGDENGLTRTESEDVKKALLELFELCKSGRFSKAAKYLVYRGPHKNREWMDVYDYNNLVERREIESVGKGIKELLERSDSFHLSRFFKETESEGQWHIWETIFKSGDQQGKVYFAFLKIRGHYALGDIDGHLTYLRLLKRD